MGLNPCLPLVVTSSRLTCCPMCQMRPCAPTCQHGTAGSAAGPMLMHSGFDPPDSLQLTVEGPLTSFHLTKVVPVAATAGTTHTSSITYLYSLGTGTEWCSGTSR